MSRYSIDGQPFDNKEDYFARIYELFKTRGSKGYTRKELAERLGRKSPEETYRSIITPLINQNLIEKIDGTNRYQSKIQIEGKEVKISSNYDEAGKKIEEASTMQEWKKHAKTSKHGLHFYRAFKLFCMGKNRIVKRDFTIYPDNWKHPDTTKIAIEILKKAYAVPDQRTQLPASTRTWMRQFLKFGLKITLSETEANQLEIGGHKDNVGEYATASLEDGQYEKAKEILIHDAKQLTLENATYPSIVFFGVHFWTFLRPSALFLIRCNQLQFFDRTIEYFEIDGYKKILAITEYGEKTIVDKATYSLIKQQKIEIKSRTERACHIKDAIEPKTAGKKTTQYKWPKFIYDEQIVKPLEAFTTSRIHRGKKFLFWENNDSTFDVKDTADFKKYDSIVRSKRNLWNNFLKDLYLKIECTEKIFFARPSYAIRHIGIQHWCILTDYDYGLISEMGWNDQETLRAFYARRTHKSMTRSFSKVIG